MMHTTLLILQVALACTVAVTCFCRLVHTDDRTLPSVVWAFWGKAVAASLLGAAPALPLVAPAECPWPPGTTPAWLWVLFLAGSVAVQVATSVHWRDGVPLDFVKDAT